MHSLALALSLILGLAEFFVINRALRQWSGRSGLAVTLLAIAASYVPAIGGAIACLAAILVLEWPWWLAGGTFIGGTLALTWAGGIAVILGQGAMF